MAEPSPVILLTGRLPSWQAVPRFEHLRPASERASAAARGASRKRDTRCEVLLRRALWALGLRYRVDVGDLPGRPDVVFRGARVAVFCDGDYWHGRDLAQRLRKLARGHNAAYWVAKIQTNVARDRRHDTELARAGWTVQRFWESEIRRDAGAVASVVAAKVAERREPSKG